MYGSLNEARGMRGKDIFVHISRMSSREDFAPEKVSRIFIADILIKGYNSVMSWREAGYENRIH